MHMAINGEKSFNLWQLLVIMDDKRKSFYAFMNSPPVYCKYYTFFTHHSLVSGLSLPFQTLLKQPRFLILQGY